MAGTKHDPRRMSDSLGTADAEFEKELQLEAA
eukprot:gene26735-biopygen17259